MNDTAFRKQERAIMQIRDLFSKARIFKMTSSAITAEYLKIKEGMTRCPMYSREYISGYFRALSDKLWEEMEFCYLIDGVLYTTNKCKNGESNKPNWRDLPDYNMKGKLCAHFWLNTDRPYTELQEA